MGAKLKVDSAMVVEGQLYEVPGEDEMIVTFNCLVAAEKDGQLFYHEELFRGHVFDDENGCNRCERSRARAQHLVDRIYDAGLTIDLRYWNR